MYAGKSLPPYIQIVQNYIKVTFHKFEDDCVDRRSPSMQCEATFNSSSKQGILETEAI